MNRYEVRALGVLCKVDAASAPVAVKRALQDINRHIVKAGRKSVEKILEGSSYGVDIIVVLIERDIQKERRSS